MRDLGLRGESGIESDLTDSNWFQFVETKKSHKEKIGALCERERRERGHFSHWQEDEDKNLKLAQEKETPNSQLLSMNDEPCVFFPTHE